MEMNDYNSEVDMRNVKYLVASLKNTSWGITANEGTVDSIFKCALDIQDTLSQEEKEMVYEDLVNKYPEMNFKKCVDLLMESIIKSQHLNEHLTLYAIKKYVMLNSKSQFSEMVNNILTEIQLRECLFQLNEELADVDLDLFRINNFLCEVLNSLDPNVKIFNALNTQTSVVLNAVKHGSQLSAQILIEKITCCLESQTDLRLWFMIMRNENLESVLQLCAKHKNFLDALLNFFDNFADEIESNYDEELNVKYSHVNLDFDEFVKIFHLFLNDKKIGKSINEYLDSKTLTNKNFCFWIDVKACV